MTAADDDARWDDSWDYSQTKFEMEQTRLWTVEKLKQSGRVKNDKVWTREDIDSMTMEEYAKNREQIHVGMGLMSPDELRAAESIPKPPKPFKFTSF